MALVYLVLSSTRETHLFPLEGHLCPAAWVLDSRGISLECSFFEAQTGADVQLGIWLWLKKRYPEWNPGKWKHGPKPASPNLFNFEPHPYRVKHGAWD